MRHALLSLLTAAVFCGDLLSSELHPADGGAPFRLGWQKAEVTKSSPVRLKKEPSYGSGRPFYLAIRLGSGSKATIVGVIDESKGKGTQFDRLYLDANNNLDLTDDPVITMAATAVDRTLSFDSAPIEVTIRYADGAQRRMRIHMELRGLPTAKSSTDTSRTAQDDISWTAMYSVEQHLEGRVDIGTRTNVLVGIYDSSRGEVLPNGCFDDYGVDRFRVDMNGDGQLDARTEDYPLSKIVSLDGRLWEFRTDSAAMDVKVAPSTLRTGRMRIQYTPMTGAAATEGEAELVSKRGYAFACVVSGDRETDLPEGEYTVASSRMTTTDTTGGTWKAVFSLLEPFSIKRGRTATATLGTPLKVVPAIHKGNMRPGNDICIVAEVTGVGGESYADISREKARMAPAVKITDANDVVVSKGNMEYG